MDKPTQPIVALILAGGQGTRMNGADKGLVLHQNKALIDHVLHGMQAQTVACQDLWVSANRNLDEYGKRFSTMLQDLEQWQGCGPMAGIHSGLYALTLAQANQQNKQTGVPQAPDHAYHALLLTLPCDSTSFPANLVEKLYQTLLTTPSTVLAAYAIDDTGPHPTFALYRIEALATLERQRHHQHLSLRSLMASLNAVEVHFAGGQRFANVNTTTT